MLRASKRKRVVPKGRGDSVAPAAKRSVLRRKVGDVHDIRSTESPVANITLDTDTEVMTMAPVPVSTTATEPITPSVSDSPIRVWIVGSSIVKNAFVESRQRPGGTNLALNRLGVNIWWQGTGGLTLSKMKNRIRLMLRLEDPPSYIIVHIGGNDIGNIKLGYLHFQLVKFMSWLSNKLPETTLIWSQVLPRLLWRYSTNGNCMEKCRRRLNSSIGVHMTKHGGCYIRYPDIKATHKFLAQDGVHLSKIGNEIFLNIIQGALETIISSKTGGITFPDDYYTL
ncbi:uncharacterized protein LOC134683112 [Mytilus trossulus]|uniref:uncharacterized protein LOC134683112 n=1 Tax=Mytilus trossulus TaxID=6551 RepID=UPI0030063C5C